MHSLVDPYPRAEVKRPAVARVFKADALRTHNESLDFVKIEQEEAGIIPFGGEFKNPNFAKVVC